MLGSSNRFSSLFNASATCRIVLFSGIPLMRGRGVSMLLKPHEKVPAAAVTDAAQAVSPAIPDRPCRCRHPPAAPFCGRPPTSERIETKWSGPFFHRAAPMFPLSTTTAEIVRRGGVHCASVSAKGARHRHKALGRPPPFAHTSRWWLPWPAGQRRGHRLVPGASIDAPALKRLRFCRRRSHIQDQKAGAIVCFQQAFRLTPIAIATCCHRIFHKGSVVLYECSSIQSG